MARSTDPRYGDDEFTTIRVSGRALRCIDGVVRELRSLLPVHAGTKVSRSAAIEHVFRIHEGDSPRAVQATALDRPTPSPDETPPADPVIEGPNDDRGEDVPSLMSPDEANAYADRLAARILRREGQK